MKDKLLIWEQNYDVVSFTEIIDRADLDAYITHWVAKFLHNANSRGNITYKYITHKIEENQGKVNIQLEHFGYRVLDKQYPPEKQWVGFDFLDLDKQPIWKP